MNKKLIKYAIFLVLVLQSLNGAEAKMSKEANKLYSEAILFENNNKVDEAIDLIQKALNNSKDDLTLTVKLAGLYARSGQTDKAIEAYKQAITINPNDAFLYVSLGNIYQQKGAYNEAYNTYLQAQNIMPDYKYNYLNLANSKFYNGEYQDAIKYYNDFLEHYPNNKEAGNLLANSYLNLKDYKNSIAQYEKVKTAHPNTFQEYSELGLAYLRNKDYTNAKKCFNEAIQINPKDYISYGNLAVVQSYLKENDLAYENYKTAFSLNPELNDLKFDYGNLLNTMGKKEDAIAAYQEYLKAHPEDKNAYIALGAIYQKEGNNISAIEILKQGTKISSDFDIKNELGKSYYQNGNYEEALNLYEEELSQNSKNLRALYNKALCLSALEEFKNADTIYKKLSLYENQELIPFGLTQKNIMDETYLNLINWGEYSLNLKDYKKAKQTFTSAIEEDPENPKGYIGLAKTYENLGSKNKVVENFEKAIQVAPDEKDVFVEFANSLTRIGEEQMAQDVYKKAYELDNKDVNLLEVLGDSYAKTSDYKKALEAYETLIQEKEDDNLFVKIGSMHKYLNDPQNAEEFYNKALVINPNNADAIFNLGLCAFDKDDFEKAKEYFQKTIDVNSHYSYAYWGLGKCYEKEENKNLAIYNYEKFIEFSDNEELKTQAKNKIDTLYKGLVD